MKLKYLLLLLFVCFNFSNSIANSISGKVLNSTENEITISGLNTKIIISLTPDGTFSKEFNIEHNGLYTFINGTNRWELFLTKDTNLNINFDQKSIDETINYIGKTANECLYLYKKHELYDGKNFNLVKTYSLKEVDFVSFVDKLIATNQEILKNTTDLDSFFRKSEEKNIVYGAQSYFFNYKFYHSYYTKSNVPKAKICESRIFNIDTVKFDFEEFLFSPVFRGYETGKFHKSFQPKFKKNQQNAEEILKDELEKINNPVIEDYILKNVASQIKMYNDKEDYLFKAIINLTKDEKFKSELKLKLENKGKFVNGSPAPNFELIDLYGKKVTLADFKGKNIYIDFWATWCSPCIGEIPDLKKMEEKFKDKNIVFLSISIDKQKDLEKWKNFISTKELGGIHLIAENAWESQIVKEYMIDSIPRFVIIDTEGNLVDVNAPRPSMGKANKAINRLDNL
jgi:peroxiredoxin